MKACKQHPGGVNGRACRCRAGWRYRLAVPDPMTGRRGRPEWSQTFPTKDAADDHQRTVRQAIADGTYTNDRGLTVAAQLAEWLEWKAATGRKASTVEGYRSVVEARIIPGIGHHRLGRLTQHHVQSFLDRVAADPQQGKGRAGAVSTGTLVNVRAVLRAALNDALRRGLVARNVATLVELPEVKRPAPVAIPADRLRTWLEHCDGEGDPLAALWLCCAVYGPRRGELLGLRWSDIDQVAHLVRVGQEVIDVAGDHPCPSCPTGHTRVMFDAPKSSAGERVWPLVPEVEAALMAHRLRQDDDRDAYGPDHTDHGLVFAQPSGDPWRPEWISRQFRASFVASGAAAGMARVPSLKALRSTSVTALHEAGVTLEAIARVTGHAGTAVTRDHYLSVSAEGVRAPFEAIASRLTSGRQDTWDGSIRPRPSIRPTRNTT